MVHLNVTVSPNPGSYILDNYIYLIVQNKWYICCPTLCFRLNTKEALYQWGCWSASKKKYVNVLTLIIENYNITFFSFQFKQSIQLFQFLILFIVN